MHLTLRQLSIFGAVARHLSYTRAAEELHLSQPAVSMQLKQLEENVGLPLLEQIGKKIFLTEAGREMRHYGRVIAQQLAEAEAVLAELKGMARGRLDIAVASTANYFATRLLATFSREHSGAQISLDVTNREGLLARLDANEIDLVIMGRPPKQLDLAAEAFMDNPLVVIAAPGHPLTRRGRVPIQELQHETFMVRERGSGTRTAMERFFDEQDVRLTTGMEMSSNEAIKQAVQAGLGLGLVSAHTLELELASERLVMLDVEGLPIRRHWYIVHRHGKRLSPMAAAFRAFVLQHASSVLNLPSGVAS
jgi:DNA-binding transcriptional LysR family regulator